MKLFYISIFLLFSTKLYAQKEHRYVFFDPCSKQILELDYQIWISNSDSTMEVKAGKSIKLEDDSFLLSTQLKSEKNDWIAAFYFNINNLNENDTLYLHEMRAMWNGLLHPQKEEYYLCESKCIGTIKEVDSDGIVRSIGKFENGVPKSNIKFFNRYGKLERTLVYKNGNLKKIK